MILLFNIVIFHFATLNNQRVTGKKTGKIPRENGMYYYEWLGLRENGLFSKNNGKLGNLLSETWTYCYCILIFVNGLAEGGIEQNRIGLSQ